MRLKSRAWIKAVAVAALSIQMVHLTYEVYTGYVSYIYIHIYIYGLLCFLFPSFKTQFIDPLCI